MTAPAPGDRRSRLEAGVARPGHQPARHQRALLVTGALCLPLGLALIVLGWYGAAHTPRLFEQVPYLISGGLLGVAVVVAGGFLLLGHWLSRLVEESRARADRAEANLARVEALLLERLPPDGPARPGALVATPRGSTLHRPGCPMLAGSPALRAVPPAAAAALTPCRVCQPLAPGGADDV